MSCSMRLLRISVHALPLKSIYQAIPPRSRRASTRRLVRPWALSSSSSSSTGQEKVISWLAQFQEEIGKQQGASYFRQIILDNDQLQAARSYSSSSSSLLSAGSSHSSSASVADTPEAARIPCSQGNMGSISSKSIQAAANAVNAVLHQQHLQLPSTFAVPCQTTVPAYQLVGLFRIFLGWPNLPQAAKAGSLEAKWRLLQLTLLHAAQQEQQFELQVHQLLDGVLLPHAQQKLAKVLANPLVPQPSKDRAQQRYDSLHAACLDTITRWAAATSATPAFGHLQPAMLQIQPAITASLAAGSWQCAPSSASSGKLMEQAAEAVLQQSLPPGWSLLPSLHLLGVEGEAFVVQQGCKYEVDMLVLDEQGVAVAIVEVKLAAANPLMSLFNDCSALMRLVDQVRGKTITAITRSDLGGCAAAVAGMLQERTAGFAQSTAAATTATAAAAEAQLTTASEGESDDDSAGSTMDSLDSSSSSSRVGSAMAKARAATATAPFASSSAWQTVHVQVHAGILPVYVLGKSIGEAEVLKGLASLVDSAALKLLSKAPADLAQAVMQPQQQQQQQRDCGLNQASNSSSSSSMHNGSSEGPGMAYSRVPLSLSTEQQRSIMQHVHRRMEALEHSMIYSLCAK